MNVCVLRANVHIEATRLDAGVSHRLNAVAKKKAVAK